MTFSSPSKGGLIAVTVVLFSLQLAAVIGRFAVRRREKVKPWVDDYLALVACIFFFAFYFITVLISVTAGSVGQHIAIGPNGFPVMPNYTTFVCQFIFVAFHTWIIGPARLSIVYLYRRIFVGKTMRLITDILTGLLIIWIVSFFITFTYSSAVHCLPDGSKVVSLNSPAPSCVNQEKAAQALGITGVLFDFVILVLPWPWIAKLQMRKPQKLGVTFIFLLGNLTLAASIVRCVFLFWSFRKFASGDIDFTYFDGINLVWTQTEAATAIICSCLPNFGKFIVKGLPFTKVAISSYLRSLFRSSASRSSTSVDRSTLNKDTQYVESKSKLGDPSSDQEHGNEGGDDQSMVIMREVEFGYQRV